MSGIADKLGTGSSFGQARRERSARGRAKAITEGDIPAYELVRLRLDEVSSTPLNPRRNFGTAEELTQFGEELRQAQLAACVAVTRGAYLALWPDHEDRIGPALHVLVNGERRFRSAVHVGLEALDFVVRNDLAVSREQFMKHLLEENLSREDFDVIERARGVQQLVSVCAEQSERGAKSRAAEQLGKDRSWVTNQLDLLELPDELQVMLSAGSLAERDGRALARHLKQHPELDAAALLDYLKETKEAAARAKAAQKAAVAAAARKGLLSADNNPADASMAPESTSLLSADNNAKVPAQGHPKNEVAAASPSTDTATTSPSTSAAEPASTDAETVLSADNKTGQRGSSAASRGDGRDAHETEEAPADQGTTSPGHHEGNQPRQLPYDDAAFVVMHLRVKMEPAVFAQSTRMMMDALREQQPDAYSSLVHKLAQQDQQLA